jgi:cytochrome c oxidase subunit 4
MVSLKLYTFIYVALFISATVQVLIEFAGWLETMYWFAFWLIIILSFIKALLVAGYFQHLRYEPASLSYLILTGLGAALALTLAASYSIQ